MKVINILLKLIIIILGYLKDFCLFCWNRKVYDYIYGRNEYSNN